MKVQWKRMCALAVSALLLLGGCLTVCAEEETEMAGYHVYETSENETSDSWYSVARGTYLQAGISKLSQGDTGYALCSGHTIAHTSCDRVWVRIYLDESENGTDGWGTLNYWTGEAYDTSVVSAGSEPYKVTSGHYYRVKGGHSVIEGETVEATTTCTNAIVIN